MIAQTVTGSFGTHAKTSASTHVTHESLSVVAQGMEAVLCRDIRGYNDHADSCAYM